MRRVVLWCGAYVNRRETHRWDDRRRRHMDGDRDWDDLSRCRRDLERAALAAKVWGAAEIVLFAPDDAVLPHEMGLVRLQPQEELEAYLRGLAERGRPEDRLLFVATNHGISAGMARSPAQVDLFAPWSPPPAPLSPQDLGALLDAIPGTQMLALACCYAGIFLPLASSRRGVLTACGAGEVYYIERTEDAHAPLFRVLFSSWLGVSLPGELAAPGSGPLSTAILHACDASDCQDPRFKPQQRGTLEGW